MSLLNLVLKSLASRKLITALLILSIGLSSSLLIGVQKIKQSAKQSFSQSISGTDLIVGARSGDIQLLMYSVFRQGQAVANMSWVSVESIRDFPQVDWLVPISLGDSHKGYPVLATTRGYFDHYRYAQKKALSLKQGRVFSSPFEIVLGAELAKTLNYNLGDSLYLSHGVSHGHSHLHKSKFTVVGILASTATPVDKTVHIPLEGMTALHAEDETEFCTHSKLGDQGLRPSSVTACLLGLKSKFSIFSVQRRINDWPDEALMAIIPGVSLARLWSSMRTIDSAFFIITILVTIIAFIGLLLVLFMSLQARQRELAILRTLGAHPSQLFLMLSLESLIITGTGVLLGLGFMSGLGQVLGPILEERLGLILSLSTFSSTELYLALAIIGVGGVTSLIPAALAYRKGKGEGFISL